MGIYSFEESLRSDRFQTHRVDPKDVAPGDIYYLRYPKLEHLPEDAYDNTMKHYGLIIDDPIGGKVDVMYMTSKKRGRDYERQGERDGFKYIELEQWEESGLPQETMVGMRISPIAIYNNFSEKVGVIQLDDLKRVAALYEKEYSNAVRGPELLKRYTNEEEEYQMYIDKIKRYNRMRKNIKEEYIEEEKLKAAERTDFGLPAKKKYPMPDEGHVKQAIRMFNHCDPEDEAELARNIKKYMRKYNMDDVEVSEKNRFSKYYHPKKNVKEEAITEDTKFSMMKDIYDQLTPEEQSFLGKKFIDSPYSVFRKVAMDKGRPVAFCEIYDGLKMLNRKEYIMEMAVVPDYRRKGLAKSLIKEMEKFCNKSDKHKRMVYLIKKENKPSETLAIKSKYKKEKIHNSSYIKSDHHVYYKWIGKTPKYEDPWDLNNWMCDNFKYGIIVDGKYKEDWIDGKDFYEHYKSPTISSMFENNVGVCWDTVNFIADYFKNCYPDSWKCYYIENEDSDTHTWFVFKDDYDRYCVCEVSWGVNQGIHVFKSEKQMLDFYIHLNQEHWGGNKGYVLYEYKAGSEYTGLNCQQFMDKIYKEGTFLGDTKGCYNKIIKPRLRIKWWNDRIKEDVQMDYKAICEDTSIDIKDVRDPENMEEFALYEAKLKEQFKEEIENAKKGTIVKESETSNLPDLTDEQIENMPRDEFLKYIEEKYDNEITPYQHAIAKYNTLRMQMGIETSINEKWEESENLFLMD